MISRRWTNRAGAVALGLVIDQLLGEPPDAVHPVARFGQAMTRLERCWWRDDRRAGAAYAAAGAAMGAATGAAITAAVGPTPALVSAVALSVAGRCLLSTAEAVGERLREGDLEGARALLSALVGRDPSGLDEKEIARAVIESVAENLSDAVVGSVVWGLAAGAPGVLVHRAANTLDAMVGYRSDRYRRFGWASARLDDLLGWPAARLTAALVLAAGLAEGGGLEAVRARRAGVWRDAPAHPSPNGGLPEAAFAHVLGLRLGGANRYGDRVEVRASMGDGRPPEPADVARAVALARRVIRLLTALLAVAWLGGAAFARLSKRRSPVPARS